MKKKDRTPIVWTSELEKAFEDSKKSLTVVTSSTYLHPNSPIILTADASATAVGGSLEQLIDTKHSPLGFYSRKLSVTECNYSPYDRELLAIYREHNVVADALSRICTINMPTRLSAQRKSLVRLRLNTKLHRNAKPFTYCLTLIDRYTRWPQAIPLKRATSLEEVATAFYTGWIATFGIPLTITTDQGPQFESALFSSLAKLIGAKRIRTTPYHPQSHGMVERFHITFKAALMCQPSSAWTELLLGLRTAYKENIKTAPAELTFGSTIRVPGEFFVAKDLPQSLVTFLDHLRKHFEVIRPTPTSYHVRTKQFMHGDLHTCTPMSSS
ncbi:uncharacterized protein LOC131675117 [Phymastichus coffea]|uniref:uncharacterized protein LOC131675117 n=1 Tax=Phymastichus coffea TaxID=108790 RepID=UPI00273A8CC5|nr:uncharacterized protein LOC131675117 [Phymastichus coffea]